ncbi:hypothetical protein [Aquimarina litoralis]|uniref:hypothetical protein n=1 Tax=Aquimarina litoralis TaxID=584605 RepID=UPI001C599B5A|nr:hypothetical protein [Aquimarina litoralis]MBW1297354.1 hypothetical protein [Aquimarina litoralis]
MELGNSQVLIQAILGLLYAIPTLLFVIISIYYIRKTGPEIDATLILVGNVIIFLCIVVGKILWIQFVFYRKWPGEAYSYMTAAISVLSVLGSLFFAVGTFLLVKKVIKAKAASA